MVAFIERLKNEWRVIRQAPFSVFVIMILCSGLAYGVAHFVYNDRLVVRDEMIRRYRIALGIEDATRTSLAVLTNDEFRRKALNLSKKLRDMGQEFESKQKQMDARFKEKERSETEKAEHFTALLKEANLTGRRFETEMRVEVLNTLNELHRRIPPGALKTIVLSLPTIHTRDSKPGQSSFWEQVDTFGPEFVAHLLTRIAQDLERLAGLL
jgi:hypothetical protein